MDKGLSYLIPVTNSINCFFTIPKTQTEHPAYRDLELFIKEYTPWIGYLFSTTLVPEILAELFSTEHVHGCIT